MKRLKRLLLYLAAALLVVWSNVLLGHTLQASGGSLPIAVLRFQTALQSDWLLMLLWVHLGIFSVAGLSWLTRDLWRREPRPVHRAYWLVGLAVFGAPVLLAYLAHYRVGAPSAAPPTAPDPAAPAPSSRGSSSPAARG